MSADRTPRSSSFLALGSVPRNTEEGRAVLQLRIRTFAKLGTALNAIFYTLAVLVIGSFGLTGGFSPHMFVENFTGSLLASVLLFASIWLITSRGRLSHRTLYWIDGAGMVLASAITSSAMWFVPVEFRPELVADITLSNMLMLRSVIIPGSATRTTWVSIATAVPLVVMTYVYYAAHPSPVLKSTPFGYAIVTVLFISGSILIANYVTRVIYGLTRQVREAVQLGEYTLDEKIGEGGMGVVWKARHSMLRRPTAVKLLPPEKAGEHNIRRFEREVQLTSLLTHPNTIAIYDFGRTPEGTFYYAMEYLEGVDLEDLIRATGALPPTRVIHVLSQVAGALEEAHGVGLIHRDIKPANLILCERGPNADVVKVVDFGLVKQLERRSDETRLSGTNSITGTPLFLAPEAIATPDQVTAESDLYALGCVGYYLLTGTHPFSGKSVVEICGHHLHTLPEPPSSRLGRALPEDLEQLLLTCLEKSPKKRPAGARELLDGLAACGDAGKWSQREARAWWEERGRELGREVRRRTSSMQPGSDASSSRPRTIAVDARARVSDG